MKEINYCKKPELNIDKLTNVFESIGNLMCITNDDKDFCCDNITCKNCLYRCRCAFDDGTVYNLCLFSELYWRSRCQIYNIDF